MATDDPTAVDGVVTSSDTVTYTLYDTNTGAVISKTSTSYPTATYTGQGDTAAFLQPGEKLDPTGADATGMSNAANHNAVMDPSQDLVQSAIDDAKAAASFVKEEASAAYKQLPTVWNALMWPIILVVAGMALFYFGPALGALAKGAVKKAA